MFVFLVVSCILNIVLSVILYKWHVKYRPKYFPCPECANGQYSMVAKEVLYECNGIYKRNNITGHCGNFKEKTDSEKKQSFIYARKANPEMKILTGDEIEVDQKWKDMLRSLQNQHI